MDKQNFSDKLEKDYEEILAKIERGMLPLVARVPLIDKAVSEYVLAQDEYFEELRNREKRVPIQLRDSQLLEKMANLMIYEELTWSHPDKMTIVEYPVMSDWQAKERRDKTSLVKDVSHDGRPHKGRRKSHGVDKNGAIIVSNPKMVDADDAIITDLERSLVVKRLLESANLTDRQRQAIDLVYFENMTQVEAADFMKVKKNTINEHLTKALKKLRNKAELIGD